MLNNFKNKIGIFDSGIGGLTVAKAISELCPQVSLLYVGDTAHMPWGDKSKAHIVLYATKITEFLVQEGCDIIVIACNTASANALKELSEQCQQIKLFNMIDPIILFLQNLKINLKSTENNINIGLIGTKQTIRSQAYQDKINSLISPKSLKVLATPILVPLIEEGLINNQATDLILEQYLSQLDLADQSVLILGCTHYGLIKKNIENYYVKINKQVTVIDGSRLIAIEIKNFLLNNLNYLNHNIPNNINNNFYVTDDSEFFLKTAKQFFANITLDFLPLWGQ